MHTSVSLWTNRNKIFYGLCKAVVSKSCACLALVGDQAVLTSLDIEKYMKLLEDPFFAAPDDRRVPKQYEHSKEVCLGKFNEFANRMKKQLKKLSEETDSALYHEAIQMVEGCLKGSDGITSISTSQAKRLGQKFGNRGELRKVVEAVLDLVSMEPGAVSKRVVAVRAAYVEFYSWCLSRQRIICSLISVM